MDLSTGYFRDRIMPFPRGLLVEANGVERTLSLLLEIITLYLLSLDILPSCHLLNDHSFYLVGSAA